MGYSGSNNLAGDFDCLVMEIPTPPRQDIRLERRCSFRQEWCSEGHNDRALPKDGPGWGWLAAAVHSLASFPGREIVRPGGKREKIDADQLRAGAGQLGLGTGRRIEFVSAAAD